jgi:hypothetical protein
MSFESINERLHSILCWYIGEMTVQQSFVASELRYCGLLLVIAFGGRVMDPAAASISSRRVAPHQTCTTH